MRTLVGVLLITLVCSSGRGQEKTAAVLRQYDWAVALQNRGDYDRAAEQWARFIHEFPKSIFLTQALFNRGECLFHAGKKKEAAEVYAELLERFPADDLADEALYALGLYHEALGQPAEAGKDFDRFLQKHPKSPLAAEVAVRRAVMLSQEKKYAEAAARYAWIASHWPESNLLDKANLAGGKCYYLAGDYAEAQKLFERVTAAGGKSLAEAAHWLVRSMIEQKQPAKAAATAEELLARLGDTPQAAPLEMDRAEAVSEIPSRRGESAALYAAMAAKYPQSPLAPQALYTAAFTALNTDDYPAAIRYATDFVKAYPDNELIVDARHVAADALYRLGWAKLRQDDYPAAEKSFDALLTKYPDSKLGLRTRYALANIRYRRKEYPSAVKDLQALLATDPAPTETSDARYLLGLCQAAMQKQAEAETRFESIVEDDPKYADIDKALYELAWAQKQQGKEPQATETFARLAAEHPDSSLATEALYHVGEAAYASDAFKKAALAYHEAWQKAGKTELGEKAVHKLGWSYFRLEKLPKAQQTFLFQRITWPDGPLAGEAAFMEGESLRKQNQYTRALAAYGKVIAQYPQSNRVPLAKQRIERLREPSVP